MNSPTHFSDTHRRRGMALVIVLSLLVILLGLVVGLLVRVSNERATASSYADAAGARALAEVAVNLVQAQISHATERQAGEPFEIWTSQPGMVRVFDSSGNLQRGYKLYSSSQLVVNQINLAEDAPPDLWHQQPARWVDLNEPVVVADRLVYPIVDPDAVLGTASNPVTAIPGLRADSLNRVFNGSPNRLPLPVQWLYVLEDGSLVSPTSGIGNLVEFSGPSAPTESNPIIGRVAFWTDDETCRVNINTASGGAFFDTPRYNNLMERDFAQSQPARREFQRYAGHPAKVDLQTVFPQLNRRQIYDLLPRVAWGGSEDGTRITRIDNQSSAESFIVPMDSDRLFSSSNELAFDPSRSRNPLTRDLLERSRFVLTTSSRAPELNLSGFPKIAIWPLHATDSNTFRSAFDSQIARVSSISGNPYFFQRIDFINPTTDFANIQRNQELYRYLQNLTEIPLPSAGLTFATKFGADRDQILTQIFDYVRSTNRNDDTLPREGRYTPARDRGDTINRLASASGWVTPIEIGDTRGFGRAPTITELGLLFICNADGNPDDPIAVRSNAIPPDPEANRALGNQALLPEERMVQMMVIFEMFTPSTGWGPFLPQMMVEMKGLSSLSLDNSPLFPGALDEGITLVGSPEGGGMNFTPATHTRTWGGYMGFRATFGRQSGGGPLNPFFKRVGGRGNIPADANWGARSDYPFISVPVRVSGNTMEFSGGSITVTLYAGMNVQYDGQPGTYYPMQTIVISIPNGTFPIPNLVKNSASSDDTMEAWWTFSRDSIIGGSSGLGRIALAYRHPNNSSGSFIRGESNNAPNTDVIRTLAPTHGDFRLLAATKNIPSSVFEPVGNWNSSTFLIHNLRESMPVGRSMFSGFENDGGRYVESSNYGTRIGSWPDLPSAASGNPGATGDWDRGIGENADGPFINMADEGSSYWSGANPPYFGAFENEPMGPSFFSPNRIMPSPGMFGSLSTHIKRGLPWRTLLFRPEPGHPNEVPPSDHFLMENFWMPVVEPYAISEPFSTAGKVNMNQQLLPFDSFIKRDTALRAAMAGTKIAAWPTNWVNNASSPLASRWDINFDETYRQLEEVFAAGDVFLSASEISDLWLVPTKDNASLASIESFWQNHAMTGENMREHPYTILYPHLTTRSNSYTVYYTAQTLTQPRTGNPAIFEERPGSIAGEMRGAVTLERYVDPNSPNIPDYASLASVVALRDARPLSDFYRWRQLNPRQFAP